MISEHVASSLHHLALGARDVERIAGFYSEVFNLPEIGRHFDRSGELRSIWLDMNGPVLMIECTSQRCHGVDGVPAGLFLIAFHIDSQDRAQFEQRLASLGHGLESRTEYSSYFRDPEGNRFAISHYPQCPHS